MSGKMQLYIEPPVGFSTLAMTSFFKESKIIRADFFSAATSNLFGAIS